MKTSTQFIAPCFDATLSVNRYSADLWAIHLFKSEEKRAKFRSIVLILGEPNQLPELDPGDTSSAPKLWLGKAAFELSTELASKLRSFLGEHVEGGAA
ncbi:hypothetical protein [Stenotrophomonas sp. NPDC077659]|uniref:hypothetical protein n=1 Tax=Stenotrophomonas sp. NPDC077659 TaxID=3390694 RepID=UPI003D005CAE